MEAFMVSEHAFDLSGMPLEAATEKAMASWLTKHGTTVVNQRGRYWRASHGGVFQPVHWMARLKSEEIRKPTPWCWGYRATLDDSAAALANAALPVHFYGCCEGLDASCLSKKKRHNLKICQKKVEIRPVDNLDLLVEEGYPLYLSAHARTGYGSQLSRAAFESHMARYFDAGFVSVLGGFLDDRLGGYLISFCVEKTAYLDTLVLGTEDRVCQIGTGLKFAFLKYLGGRPGLVTEVIDGLHARENEGLCTYKERMGFKIVRVPSRVWFMPGTDKALQFCWPDKYYRLTGRG
jgi:hypothetical protein